MLIFNGNSIKEILRLYGGNFTYILEILYVSIITKSILFKAKTNIGENYFSFLTKLVFIELIIIPICYLSGAALYNGNFNENVYEFFFVSNIFILFGLIFCGIIEYIICIKNNILVKIEQKNNYHIFIVSSLVLYAFLWWFFLLLFYQMILKLFWTDSSVAPPWFLDTINILSPFMGGLATLVIIQFVEMESPLKKSLKDEDKIVLSCSINSYATKGLRSIIIHASVISLIFPLIIFYIFPIVMDLVDVLFHPLAYLSSLF